MKTTILIILAIIAYLSMGIFTWFLMCLFERLHEDGDYLLFDDAGFFMACLVMWVIILPFGGFFIFSNIMRDKAKKLIDMAADAIEDKDNDKG